MHIIFDGAMPNIRRFSPLIFLINGLEKAERKAVFTAPTTDSTYGY
jgi:hypothetical protein